MWELLVFCLTRVSLLLCTSTPHFKDLPFFFGQNPCCFVVAKDKTNKEDQARYVRLEVHHIAATQTAAIHQKVPSFCWVIAVMPPPVLHWGAPSWLVGPLGTVKQQIITVFKTSKTIEKEKVLHVHCNDCFQRNDSLQSHVLRYVVCHDP